MLELCEKIRDKYDFLIKNYCLRGKKRSYGEVDVYAVRNGEADVYEVKCSFRPVKAKKQIKKLNKFLEIKNAYLYCGSSGQLQEIDFKKF
ncbi:MAG: hypothetical protein HYS32_04175 [Candidatus Woesearchaeota archaeon]|nr:MAG: hypothetical protein HYS32_04175 [Candidatus Woesearchaeota archaeon]